MNGSDTFATFLDALLEDVAQLRAGVPSREPHYVTDPEASDTVARPAAIADQPPPDEFTTAQDHPIGLGTVTDTASPPDRRARRTEMDVNRILDWVIVSRGAGFLRDEPAWRLLLDPASLPAIRTRVLAIIGDESELSNALVAHVPGTATAQELLAMLQTLLHLRELADVLERLNSLLDHYLAVIALDTVIASFRLRGLNDELQQRVRGLRRGRNVLSAVVRAMSLATRPAGWTHQLFVERQLADLMALRLRWQNQQQIAALAGFAAPSPADLDNVKRRAEIAAQDVALRADIEMIKRRRAELRAFRSSEGVSREERRAAQRELSVLWPLQKSKMADRQLLRQERQRLGNELSGRAYERAVAYLRLEQRGIRRPDALHERDKLLTRADELLPGSIAERLNSGTEDERWERYKLLLTKLLKNERGVGVELFMDSFLKVAQYTERGRDIGLETHQQGQVQWLSYPGHGDGAVDLNCAARLGLSVTWPDELTLPERLQTEPIRYQHATAMTKDDARGTTDLQDIFGHIAAALVPSRSGRGASSDEMANLYSRNEGSDLAPEEVFGRQFSYRQVTSILIGLLADNLTSVANAREFNALREGIVDDLEASALRVLNLPRGTRLFRRGVSVTGRGSLGRFIKNVSERDLVAAVITVLSSPTGAGYTRREHLVHRLWRLTLWMRSAGAEAHRRAGSLTVRHVYRSRGQSDLFVEVYYTHLHHVGVQGGAHLRDGQKLGLTGMTGNAINPHVHIELRALHADTVLGSLLPHEFFPLRPQS